MHATRSVPAQAATMSCTSHEVVPSDIRGIICLRFDPGASSTQIGAFKEALIANPHVLHLVESSGAYDIMLEASAPDMPTFDSVIRPMLHAHARLLIECRESFVCRRFVRMPESSDAIWVPLAHGMKRIDIDHIDKITAEGDYMRVHAGGNSWLVHRTMQSLARCLNEDQFAQVHRSTIVRCNFVESVTHEGGHHVLHLADGSRERVSRSRAASVLAQLRGS